MYDFSKRIESIEKEIDDIMNGKDNDKKFFYRVYFQNSCTEYESTHSRHKTRKAAIKECARANKELNKNSGGNVYLLCGFVVQKLVNNEWEVEGGEYEEY